MFLMNAPPVAALRSKWEAFRFPGCFSEPEAAVARASVSARVHMVISSLQRGVSHEPATPRSHRAERGTQARPPVRPGQQPLLAACGLEPAAPDSDSDDSVDRDIEEAIQEYLRARGGAAQHAGAGRCKPEPVPVAAPCPDHGGRKACREDRESASPASVSSDDSFEQSIRAEIEQFLRQKRQQETHRGEGATDRSPDPGESPARSTSRPGRELAGRAAPPARPDPAGASREFVFRKAPRWTKVNGQPRGLRAEAAQQRGGAGRRPPRAQSSAPAREASDSSSDDGIEEAIQLYQLEKTRRGTGGGPPSDSGSSAARPGLPETHRRTPSKKKCSSAKAADPGPLTKPPRAGKAAAPPCCRADAAAELLCAEAILDISKAILPAPGEGSGSRPPASLLLRPPDVPSRADGGDGSSVDSDDSIEQEIRAFLALKAQAGSLLARAEGSPQPTQGPHSQPGDPRAPLPRPPEPLSCSRKRRSCGSSLRPLAPKKTREPRDGGQGAGLSQGRAQPGQHGQDLPGQGRAGGELPREEASGQPAPCRAARLSDTQASPGPGRAEEARSAEEKESSQDKSSSLDSDEDLDTAIKDLLRSKRKLRKRGRDPRATGRKKVRFSTPETRLSDRLGGAPRGCGEQSPQVLKSCPSPCRRKPPNACTRPEAALAGEGAAPVSRPRGRASSRGCPSSGEAAARDRPRPAVSEDTSSVDSDDSIELEIRKFLAEKARESTASACQTPAGDPLALGTGTPALQPGVCTRSQRARGAPSSASLFAQGGKGAPLAELGPGLTTALAGCAPAAPRSASGVVSAKGSPGSKSGVYVHKDQSPRGAEPAASDSAPGQLPKAGSEARGAGGTFHVSYGSRSLLTPSPGPLADLPLPWSDFAHPARLPSPWALSSEGKGSAWTMGLRGEKEKGAEGPARGPLGLTLDPRKGPSFSGFSPLLSTQLFHFGRGVSWGGKHPGLFSAHLGLPLQSPRFSAVREAPAGHGPVFGGSHLLGQEAGPWPQRKARAGLSPQDRRGSGSGSGSGGPCADLRYRPGASNTDPQDPEALGSDASELSDASVEDGVGARP